MIFFFFWRLVSFNQRRVSWVRLLRVPGDMPAPFKLPTRIGSSSVLRTTDHYRRYTLGGISSATRLKGWRNPPLTNQTSVVTADLTAGVESHRAATTSVRKSAAPGLEPGTSKSGVCSSHRYAIQSGYYLNY